MPAGRGFGAGMRTWICPWMWYPQAEALQQSGCELSHFPAALHSCESVCFCVSSRFGEPRFEWPISPLVQLALEWKQVGGRFASDLQEAAKVQEKIPKKCLSSDLLNMVFSDKFKWHTNEILKESYLFLFHYQNADHICYTWPFSAPLMTPFGRPLLIASGCCTRWLTCVSIFNLVNSN